MYVGSDAPAADALYDAERFGVEGIRVADDSVKNMGDRGFLVTASVFGSTCMSKIISQGM
jgi:hypothetical protein